MDKKLEKIQTLKDEKKRLEEQIKSLNFRGYPEIKQINGKKYIYLRYKKYDRLSSQYAGVYSDELFNSLKEMSLNVKQLKTKLRLIKTKLAYYGFDDINLPAKVLQAIDYVRHSLKDIIYDQAVVEGVSATFLDTEEILEKGQSKNVTFDDTLKILNLKNAWAYVLDEDTLKLKLNINVLSTIAGYVNDRLVSYPDSIRQTNARIGGCSYKPPIPTRESIVENLKQILSSKSNNVDIAIKIFLYICKTQIFNDGNKRSALIAANFYLIKKSYGYISVPPDKEKEFKQLLVDYYEGKSNAIVNFIKKYCCFPMK